MTLAWSHQLQTLLHHVVATNIKHQFYCAIALLQTFTKDFACLLRYLMAHHTLV